MLKNKSLKTALYIVLSTIVLSIVVYFIYNLYNKDKINDNEINNSNLGSSKFSGTYLIEVDTYLLGEDHMVEDANINFFNDNKFTAYLSWGKNLHGNYIINDNIINCTVTSFSSEYSPEQKTEATISFEVLNDSTIKVLEASETYRIKTTMLSNGTWVLTDDDKDFYLFPFFKGIKFNLEK